MDNFQEAEIYQLQDIGSPCLVTHPVRISVRFKGVSRVRISHGMRQQRPLSVIQSRIFPQQPTCLIQFPAFSLNVFAKGHDSPVDDLQMVEHEVGGVNFVGFGVLEG
jgi:hypothetical protein